jgi:hypothetical protein
MTEISIVLHCTVPVEPYEYNMFTLGGPIRTVGVLLRTIEIDLVD